MSKQKIALTTWFHYHNYGTALQVVALSETIKSLGCHTDVVNYIPHGTRYSNDKATDWSELERVVDKERERRFAAFIDRNLSLTKRCETDEDFIALNQDYHAFVTGSDQIWSPIVFDPRYFLDYVTDNRKKISYAPSTGVSVVKNEFVKEKMASLISQFAHLSAREKSGADVIANLTGKKAEPVLDPTLLLDYAAWRTIIPAKKSANKPKKYILCHFLGDNENAWKHAVRISEEQKMQLKIVPVFTKDAQYGEFQMGVGPAEFFNLLDEAEMVLTDSFHSVIFSLICAKPFYAFERFHPDDPISQNSRIYNMLEAIHLKSRLVGYDEPVRQRYGGKVDFSQANKAIREGREKSLNYLKDSLRIESPLVSVLLPIYNVEKYIKRCLDSVLAQTYQNLEIIVVDDGTPDRAGKIADQYAKKDKRITVVHKENGGLASTRNAGLDLAHGEYVVFIDSDDVVAPTFIEYMVGLIENMGTNIAASLNCFSEYWDGHVIENDRFELWSPEKAIEGIYAWFYREAVWNKIYRRSFIEKHHLRFREELLSAEGMTFNIMALQVSGPVAIGQKQLYFQTFNPDSATRATDIKRWDTTFAAYKYQKRHAKIMNDRIKKAYDFHIWWNYASIARLIYQAGEEKKHAAYLRKMLLGIRKHIFWMIRANIPAKRKWQNLQIFFYPKRALAKVSRRLMDVARNNNLINPEVMPWDQPEQKPAKKTELTARDYEAEIADLRAENERLRAELASFMGIKRSARLLAGNIKRRIQYGRNRQ